MSAGGPDLFVICKNCGSEVSPYITECPYCGNRLRKRAPKLDRHGRIAERSPKRVSASLPRLRRGEIPGIRHDSRPYGTMLLVAIGLLGSLLWRVSPLNPPKLVINGHLIINGQVSSLLLGGPLQGHLWRALSAPFFYANGGYTFVALGLVALYGTLMERRHGPLLVIALFLIGAVGGVAVAGEASKSAMIMGGNGGALALLVAWAVPDLQSLRRKQDYDGDLIGTAVLAAVMALMHLADSTASFVAAGVGALAGLAFGYLLARIHPT